MLASASRAGVPTSRDIHGVNGGTSSRADWFTGPILTITPSSLRTAVVPLKTPRVGGTSA